MSSQLLSPKSGMSSSQVIGSNTKRRKGLLQDNSWIRRDAEEDDPVDEDPNYGRDVLGNIKTSNYSRSTTTTKSTISSPTVTSPTATKPPVPAKKPSTTTTSSNFTARVFSGANSNDKVLSPVKSPVSEKYPIPLKEPAAELPKKPASGLSPVKSPVSEKYPTPPKEPPTEPPKKPATGYETDVKASTPQTTTISSSRNTTETFTTPEKTKNTEVTYTRSYEQRSSFGPTTTTTTITSTSNYDKSPSSGMDGLADYLIPTPSPTVQTNPTRTTTETTMKSSSAVYKTSPSSTVNPTPVLSPAPRIVGKRDLCSFCAKGIVEGERIILEDLNIYSHTFCFKCETCFRSLGNLEAGDPLWVHKGRVICASCFIRTKDQWYH